MTKHSGLFRIDTFEATKEFHYNLLGGELSPAEFAFLLVTMTIALGGLVYFCVKTGQIFPSDEIKMVPS